MNRIQDPQNRNRGFTLVELAVVVMIVGILSSIAIPHFLGMQKKARARVIVESCATVQRELFNWMMTVSSGESRVVDFNGDGNLDAADDAGRPANLPAIPAVWDLLHAMGGPLESLSPYSNAVDLYSTAAAPGSGQIAVTCTPNTCRIQGFSDKPAEAVLYDRMIATD